MEIIVQKFGGTSVATEESRIKCVEHVRRELSEGKSVVVIVSAIGRKGQPYATDTLIGLLEEGSGVGKREKDLLLSTGEIISATLFSSLLNKSEIENVVLTGGQAGIITNNNFGSALILDINPSRIKDELKKGKVVVIPGFQGMTLQGEITTLGRGGSDTSAAAIAAGLSAKTVDIYTDVEGLMTADPRVVTDALHLERISYQDVAQMARSGANVIHPRAVELAMNHDIPMRIRSTFSSKPGTNVLKSVEGKTKFDAKEIMVSGVVSDNNIQRFVIDTRDNSSKNDKFDELFLFLKQYDVSIDFINVSAKMVMFTVVNDDSKKLEEFLRSNHYKFKKEENVSKISVIGNAINGVPGVMSRIVHSLSINNIEILQTSDSNATIWLLVDRENERKSVQSIHKAFFEKNMTRRRG